MRKTPATDSKTPEASSSATDSTVGRAVAKGISAEKQKVISPELRGLLSRKVDVLHEERVE